MSDYKSWFSSCVLIVSILVFVCAGCSDNSEDKVAKHFLRASARALDIASKEGDFDKADKVITKVLKEYGRGKGADPVFLAGGDINLAWAQNIILSAQDRQSNVYSLLDRLSVKAEKIILLTIELEHIKNLLDATAEDIKLRKKLLSSGDQRTPGIMEQLSVKSKALQKLDEQTALLTKVIGKAQAKADDIQAQADARLVDAKNLSGDAKLKAERQAYALLQNRADHFVDAQEALDKINILESEIAIIAPLVRRLEDASADMQNEITALETSPERKQLRKDIEDTKDEIEDKGRVVLGLLADIETEQKAYAEQIEKALSLFQNGADYFAKLKSRSVRKSGNERLSQAYYQSASTCVDMIKYYRLVSARLDSISISVDGNVGAKLTHAANAYTQAAGGYTEKAQANFDLAIEGYEKLKSGSARGDDFDCAVIESHLLALYGNMAMAEIVGEYDKADDLVAKAMELMEKAKECNPNFERSVVARLINDEMDYVPSLPVDRTDYYNEMKKQFQDWKTLPGSEKEAEIRRLLAVIAEMEASESSEEFDQIIGPEKQQLEQALAIGEEKGFEAPTTTSRAHDPNFL